MTDKSLTTELPDAIRDRATPDLDITALTCPMTFVRVRLLLDNLAPGSEATVRLSGDEPRRNIPHQLRRLGHTIVHFGPESADTRPATPEPNAAPWRLTFRKQG
jgi:tRNA 2-thiouridine synthesizing protein A